MRVGAALLEGSQLLEQARIAAPRLTAEVLLAHALGRDRTFLYSHPEAELREVEWIHYGRYLHERMQGKPTQYITGRQEFYGRTFRVTPAVLIPRPETEHLIEVAKELRAERVVDVGCGSGAIAVTLCLETGARVWATDVSEPALAVAKQNAVSLGAEVVFVACDLAGALADRSVDLVVSNPPYVPAGEMDGLQREVRDYEPRIALAGGPTGSEFYERLIAEAARVLRPGGRLALELGYNSAGRVVELLSSRFRDAQLTADLAGIPRVVACQLK